MTVQGGYRTPWDYSSLPSLDHYFEYLGKYLGHGGHVRVTPYIGLAYYDGAEDGVYTTSLGSFNLASGNYPNLYNNNLEAGNYIEANPIVLGDNVTSTHELVIRANPSGTTFPHCQVDGTFVQGGPTFSWNPEHIFFDLENNHLVQPQSLVSGVGATVTPTASATPQEVALLSQFGKVFYYKIELGLAEPNTFYETLYISAYEISNVDRSSFNFSSIGYQDQPFMGDLYFHSLSNEIVVDMITVFNLRATTGLNIHLTHPDNNPPPSNTYLDVNNKPWYFSTHFAGREPGLSLYIYN